MSKISLSQLKTSKKSALDDNALKSKKNTNIL